MCRSGIEFLGALSMLSDLAVMHFSASAEAVLFHCLKGVTQLRRLVLFESGMNLESFESLPSMPLLEHLSLEGCAMLTPQCLQILASKFPGLQSLTIGCQSEASLAKDFNPLPEMPLLKHFKLLNSHGVDLFSLKTNLRDTTAFSHVMDPDLDLMRAIRKRDYHIVEDFLKSVRHPEMPQVPVFGEYFTPSVLTDLAAKGHFDLMKLLVSYGADVDYGNPVYAWDGHTRYDCSTALHFAVHRGDAKGETDPRLGFN